MYRPYMAAIAIATAVIASSASAQDACTTTTTNPCFNYKQDRNSREYQIGSFNPAACDDEIQRAFSAWSAAGSNFSATQSATYANSWYDYYSLQPGYQVTFEPADNLYLPDNNAETHRGYQTGHYQRADGVVIPMVNDGDIIVNHDRYMYGYLECGDASPTSSQRDVARTVAHEVGHVAGMFHVSDPACATYSTAQTGKAFLSLCSRETTALKQVYGTWSVGG